MIMILSNRAHVENLENIGCDLLSDFHINISQNQNLIYVQ